MNYESKNNFNEKKIKTSSSYNKNILTNILTVDVEDYFHVTAFENYVDFNDWGKFDSRIEKNTRRLLELLNRENTKATFFFLGWVAEKYKNLVREVKDQGHEIGCHSFSHKMIFAQKKEEFKEDTKRAKSILENLIGERVIGYRAPTYSITKDSLWALDILIEMGFQYDSSIFPIHHDRYGIPNFPRNPHYVEREGVGRILEFPLSTVKVLNYNIPIAGGGYFRLFPYKFIQWGIKRINLVENKFAIIYVHPWEFDPGQPKIKASYFKKFRHYLNLEKTETKFCKLIKDFRFTSFESVIENTVFE